jgi:S1-C subfamily serine protease
VSGRTGATALAAAALAGCGGGDDGKPDPVPPPRVLAVRVPTPLERTGAHATAFGLGDRRAVTAAHVIRARGRVRVGHRRARVLRIDRRLDVAVFRTAVGRGPAPRRGSARKGERVTVRVLRPGGPRSLQATVRRTIVARVKTLDGRVRTRPALELAATVQPGDSGAPVLDGSGRVVGVVFAQARGRRLAYAVDARALGAILGP